MLRPLHRFPTRAALAALSAVFAASPALAEVKVAALISDHMVVQQGRPIHLWGSAAAGESVQASFAGAQGATRAGQDGRWSLTFPALAAGGPYAVELHGTNTLAFHDVWVGEVWIASGQSNMEFPLSRALAVQQAVTAACPGLRLFTVTKATAATPNADVAGSWQTCGPDTAEGFSAVAFYFGQELNRVLGVPVGLIHSSWGGTPAEAWTPRSALTAKASLKPMVDELDAALADTKGRADLARRLAEWEAKNYHADTGNEGFGRGYASPDASTTAWPTMDLPQFWETAGLAIDGAVWFRRDVDVPDAWAGHDLALSLGPVDDFDTTYWNGEKVGAIGAETPQYYSALRNYTVPGHLVKAGRNVIAVRVFDHYGNGGFGGSRPQMTLGPAGGEGAVSLAGPWSYKIERELPPAVVDFSTQPTAYGADNPSSPTVLWNAMVEPLVGYPLAGAIWYQGEANASRAYQYRTLFPTMIEAWRKGWDDPDMPFLFVQLANFNPAPAQPGDSDWAELREAQTLTLGLPHKGMAVILDIGEAGDIHPRDKRDVGLRLAAQALKGVYGKDVVASGPTFAGSSREGGALRVRFESVAGGLVTADGAPPRGFAVAGSDRKWHWAEARIDGDSVVASSRDVPDPVAVRYGWADNPPNTLRNVAGFPAGPFRTDDWPGITAPR
jgi:sialate O-acetylesterase